MNARRTLAGILCALCLILLTPGIARADPLPPEAYISGLRGYPQRFTLSCESRSAVDWASYWGVEIREKKFLSSLPRSDNPETGFVGNPNDEWGNVPPRSYGVHAEPVAALLRQYSLQAQARRDLSWDDLRVEIAAGRPVIVWVVGQMWSGTPVRYKASDGQSTIVAQFEHTMILIGYDPAHVRVIDAFSGQNQTYSVKTFLKSWGTLGRMAITGSGPAVVTPTPAPAPTPAPPSADQLTNRTFMPMVYRQPWTPALASQPVSPPQTYKVRRGDTLAGVARQLGLDWQELASLNGIGYPYVIYTGQALRLR
jgi:uncharacterized protein YvpB